ncbi:hypothetical protein P4O66_014737 [Electrophorus voltai]|uniref:Groucho/TLE N-terminal Q-rich domain-containing protein n=1 Tax=Electrophorus voltai TaxID=2609070 RepID=A0AAD8Z1U5_9TELE|nr:hypothetical protein P4O66_014737 [Electrophorus voltai]
MYTSSGLRRRFLFINARSSIDNYKAPPLVPGHAGMKFTVLETLDHIKEEFQLFQAQYHSLKLECEKLATEKTEMHRHYIMYYEMSYGLNIEMQKQAEIVKRLSAICTQILPLLSQEHQHQVAQAVERSKHVSMADLNAIIGVRLLPSLPLHQSHISVVWRTTQDADGDRGETDSFLTVFPQDSDVTKEEDSLRRDRPKEICVIGSFVLHRSKSPLKILFKTGV